MDWVRPVNPADKPSKILQKLLLHVSLLESGNFQIPTM